jgi:hypothetical protein
MEINNLSLTALSNEEHFKFFTDVDGLIITSTPAALEITTEHIAFSATLENEKDALNYVRKSTLSDKLIESDFVRDTTLKGLKKVIEGGLKHFKPAVRNAADRLIILFNTDGNITAKAYDKESAAIIKLIADLEGTYAADVTTLAISDWVIELKANNNAFDALMIDRYNEQDDKTRLRMKEVRIELDAIYRKITKRINALIIVNGEANYTDFVNKLNLRIDAYSKAMAHHNSKGKNIPPVVDEVQL